MPDFADALVSRTAGAFEPNVAAVLISSAKVVPPAGTGRPYGGDDMAVVEVRNSVEVLDEAGWLLVDR